MKVCFAGCVGLVRHYGVAERTVRRAFGRDSAGRPAARAALVAGHADPNICSDFTSRWLPIRDGGLISLTGGYIPPAPLTALWRRRIAAKPAG